MGAVAKAMFQRLQDQVALDIGDGAADQRAGDLLGGKGRVRHRGGGLGKVEAVAVGREDCFVADAPRNDGSGG